MPSSPEAASSATSVIFSSKLDMTVRAGELSSMMSTRRPRIPQRARTRLRHLAETGGETEGAPLAELARHANFPAHQFGKPFGDGEPKPRAAVFACRGGVGLLE